LEDLASFASAKIASALQRREFFNDAISARARARGREMSF